MYRIIFISLLFISSNTQPIFAQSQSLQIKTNLTFFSERFLGVKNGHRYSNRMITELDLRYNSKNLSSQLSFNYNGDKNYTLDGSYLQKSSGIITYGVGSIGRHWSFSNNTSLILSQNARPSKSIYVKLKNKFKSDWFQSEASWSFEAFNGFTKGALNNKTSMIAGYRAILTAFNGLNFELVQTSQWGGQGQSTGLSAFGATTFFNSNSGSNSNINKMAGFGLSYLIPNKSIPLRIYSQVVGEDEAGGLPSCFAYLAGLEWTNSKIKYPTILGIETIDTRIDTTTNGNCGPNTMYNNNTYDYINYGKIMGTAIDTEGQSLEFFGSSQLSQNINIRYSTKLVTINDKNWADHRLSSRRQSGSINSLDASWSKNNTKFSANIYYQDFTLNKASLEKNYGIGFSTSVIF